MQLSLYLHSYSTCSITSYQSLPHPSYKTHARLTRVLTRETNGLLTIETAPSYVTERAEVIGVFAPDAALTATEINGGNLNYAFHVTDGERSVFVKQAPDFIKCFGPSAQLHKERMELEVPSHSRLNPCGFHRLCLSLRSGMSLNITLCGSQSLCLLIWLALDLALNLCAS